MIRIITMLLIFLVALSNAAKSWWWNPSTQQWEPLAGHVVPTQTIDYVKVEYELQSSPGQTVTDYYERAQGVPAGLSP